MVSVLPELTDATRRKSMRLSRVDAAVYALMVGLGEAYFLADGVRLGATPTQIALLVGVPLAVGGLGTLLALRLLRRLGRRKPIVVGAAACQATILLLLAWLDATGGMTAGILIAVAAGYQLCAQTAGTAWSSWYGDLVPAAIRGEYFATRNRGAYSGTLLGLLVSGLILSRLEPASAGMAASLGGRGFAAAYLLAGICRCVSVGLLASSSEGRFSGMPNRSRVGRFFATERGSHARRLVLGVGLLYVTIFIASPFFNPYMLEELEFTYVEYMTASASMILAKVFMLPLWGRSIDRCGARLTLVRGALILAVVPLPWVFVDELWSVLLCQALSGCAWSGFEIGHFSLMLELGYRRMRPTMFAAQSLVTGCAQLIGGLLGSALLAGAVDPRAVFALSGILRIVVAAILMRTLPRTRAALPARVAWRVAGMRAGSGLTQRPIEAFVEEPRLALDRDAEPQGP